MILWTGEIPCTVCVSGDLALHPGSVSVSITQELETGDQLTLSQQRPTSAMAMSDYNGMDDEEWANGAGKLALTSNGL